MAAVQVFNNIKPQEDNKPQNSICAICYCASQDLFIVKARGDLDILVCYNCRYDFCDICEDCNILRPKWYLVNFDYVLKGKNHCHGDGPSCAFGECFLRLMSFKDNCCDIFELLPSNRNLPIYQCIDDNKFELDCALQDMRQLYKLSSITEYDLASLFIK